MASALRQCLHQQATMHARQHVIAVPMQHRLAASVRPLHSSHSQVLPVVRAAASDVYEDIDWTEDLPAPVRRRVAALREVQQRWDEQNKEYHRERAELELKYQKFAAPMLDERTEIVSGRKAVGTYDVPDSDEADTGIPEFWLTAMTNHELVGEYITERDAEVLRHLTDVRTEVLTGEDAGSFRLVFTFEQNPYFSNKTLEKTFFLDDPEELVPRAFIGSPIDWAPGKDTTVEIVKRRVSDKKLKGKAPAVTVNRSEPCDSFFNFFSTPKVPENPDDLSEEELEKLQENMDEDYELGVAFKESIIPRAVEWYTGEAAPPMLDEYEEGEEYEEE